MIGIFFTSVNTNEQVLHTLIFMPLAKSIAEGDMASGFPMALRRNGLIQKRVLAAAKQASSFSNYQKINPEEEGDCREFPNTCDETACQLNLDRCKFFNFREAIFLANFVVQGQDKDLFSLRNILLLYLSLIHI